MGVMSTIEAIIKAIRQRGEPDEVEADKAVDEELNQLIPKDMSGRGAVLTQREKMRKIDEMLQNQ
jgi:hypothetical protein